MAAGPEAPVLVHRRIMDLIRKVWAGEEVDPAELTDAVPFKGFSLLSEAKQLSIFADVYNIVRSEADLRNALKLLDNIPYRIKVARHSFRRKKIADDLFACVEQGLDLTDAVKEAFGI